MTATMNGTTSRCTCTNPHDRCPACRAYKAAARANRPAVKAPEGPPESTILPPGRELLTAEEVAHVLGMGVRSVFRYSKAGKLPPPIKITRKLVRWSRAAVMRFVESLGGAPPAA